MGSYILCQVKRASMPYYIENIQHEYLQYRGAVLLFLPQHLSPGRDYPKRASL